MPIFVSAALLSSKLALVVLQLLAHLWGKEDDLNT